MGITRVVAGGEVTIGDNVLFRQRSYALRGFTRVSSAVQHVLLEDVETGEFFTVPLADVERVEGTRAM